MTVKALIESLGGPTDVAKRLGLKWPSMVTNWMARDQIPAQRVLDFEREFGISRHEIRPDVFGKKAA